jgi:two-component system C4-dicarboxylate transport sensor histidine kinase DctB
LAALGEMSTKIMHEIKNPLAVVKGYTYLIRQCLLRGEPIDPNHHLMRIEHAVDRMVQIIENMRSFSKPDRKAPVSLVSIDVVVQEALFYWRQRWSNLMLTVEGQSKAVLRANESELVQVLANILNNAAEACGDGGSVKLTISDHDGVVDLTISDSGPGVPAEVRDQIFDPFVTTKAEGTGLGLAICADLIKSIDGSIELMPNTKNSFRIRLKQAKGLAAA